MHQLRPKTWRRAVASAARCGPFLAFRSRVAYSALESVVAPLVGSGPEHSLDAVAIALHWALRQAIVPVYYKSSGAAHRHGGYTDNGPA